jgi:lipopolysaccharide export system ATP-binding protein
MRTSRHGGEAFASEPAWPAGHPEFEPHDEREGITRADGMEPEQRSWHDSADVRFDYAQPNNTPHHGQFVDRRGWDEAGHDFYDADRTDAPSTVGRQPLWDDTERESSSSGDTGADAEREPRWADRSELSQHYLAVHGVEKSFGGRKVVKGVSLYLRRGEAVGLLGPNGAGKTTVFYMITGLVKADRGRIELDGHDITGLPMYQHGRLGIGYLPQEASIFRGLNVEQNIRAVLEQVEPDRRKREAELDALLDEFNIAHLRKTPSIALSGGERRRVEIARALATRPSYMLLDEPFAGIDPIAVGDIQALVRHLTQRGIGVLITDHNVRETLGLTDRAYIIYSGEVLMEGNTSDIVNDPEVRRLYLGEEFRL